MTLQEIKNIIKIGEGISTEFKESKNKLPKNLFETVCAFLNTKGGVILLGVKNDGEIIGVNKFSIEQLKKDIANLSNNSEKLFPVYFLQIQDIEIRGERIIAVEVPESSQVHKTNEKIFIRNQDGDYLVKHPVEIARIVNRKQNYHSEQRIFPQVNLEEFDSALIARVKNLIKFNMPENHWWELDDKDFLIKAGLYRNDESGKYGYTLAAVLFFGTDELIQTLLPAYKFEALLRRDNIDRYDDRLTVRTNIINAYDLLMSFIDKHLNDPFYLEGDQRISLRSKIFRELVANIIAHREYLSPAPAIITILEDKIEFKNPNNPKIFGKIDPDVFTPLAKNPTISKLMLLMGLVEEVGSGVHNVRKYLPFYSRNASFEFVDEDFFKTIIYLPAYDISPKKDSGKSLQNTLAAINNNPQITIKQLQEITGLTTRAIEKQIAGLKKRGILKRIGPDKGGSWEIVNKSEVRGSSEKKFGESSEKKFGESSEKIINLIKQDANITISEISKETGLSTRAVEKQITKLKKQDILERIGPDKGGLWEIVNKSEVRRSSEKKFGESSEKRFGESSEKKFGESSEKIISLIKQDANITILEISKEIGLATRTIEKQIAKLKQQGALKRIGSDKGGYWEVVENAKED